MDCPYCKKPAEWVSNEAVYGGRRYGKSYMIWLCVPCDARVGCHQNTKRPLGTMANKELREVRIAAHANIDSLWRSGDYRRSDVYRAMNKHFGKEIHVGESDIELAQQIADLDTKILETDLNAQHHTDSTRQRSTR